MTLDEAKLVLDNARPQTKEIDRQFYDDEDLNNAIDMAIKVLEQQPSEDCVSRQAVLDMAKSYNTDGWDSYTPLVVDVEDIEELPPVTPTSPKNATNGDMIKAMFPSLKVEDNGGSIYLHYPNGGWIVIDKDWWNAPYKRGDSDGSN